VDALIKAVHNNNGKFIWAIGGWSDLTKTIKPEQIDTFVNKVVELLKLSGDGVDFDWEHLSQDEGIKTQQLDTLAETLLKLRQALDKAGMQDKLIGYTTRFNAFMGNASDYGFSHFASDGEGLAINNWLKAHNSSLNAVVDWVNIMAYDVGPSDMPNGQTWTMKVYNNVFNTFAQHIDKSKIVMGFEPGGQATGGVWEGMEVDKLVIDHIASMPYGGSMFWAINQPAYLSPEVTGDNAYELANYSQQKFGYTVTFETGI
jgi:GH18 family chitinase